MSKKSTDSVNTNINEKEFSFPTLRPITMDYKAKTPWFKNYRWVAVLLSIAWVFIASDYVIKSGWWANRTAVLPQEFIGFLSGMLLPIVLIWIVFAYFERGIKFERESRMLRDYMSQLVYPNDDGAVYTKALTDSLRAQIAEFRQVFSLVVDNTENVKNGLSKRIEELGKLNNAINTITAKSVQELAVNAKQIIESAADVTEKTKETNETLRWQVNSLNAATEQAVATAASFKEALVPEIQQIVSLQSSLGNQSEGIIASIKEQGSMVDDISRQVKSHADYLAEVFENRIKGLDAVADKTRISAGEVMHSITEKHREMDEMFVRQQQRMEDLSSRLKRDTEDINGMFVSQKEQIDDQSEQLSSRFRIIEDGLRLQSRELESTALMMTEKLGNVAGELRRQAENLVSISDSSTSKVVEITSQYTAKTAEIAGVADQSDNRIAAIIGVLSQRMDNFNSLGEQVAARLHGVGNEITGQIENIDRRVSNAQASAAAVAGSMKQHSDTLGELVGSNAANIEKFLMLFNSTIIGIDSAGAKISEIEGRITQTAQMFGDRVDGFDKRSGQLTSEIKQKAEQMASLAQDVEMRATSVHNILSGDIALIDDVNVRSRSLLENVTEDLNKHRQEIFKSLSEIEDKAEQISGLIEHHNQTVRLTSNHMQERAQSVVSMFNESLDALNSKAGDVVGDTNKATKSLIEATDTIDSMFKTQHAHLDGFASELENKHANTDTMLRGYSKLLMENLDSISQRASDLDKVLSDNMRGLLTAADTSTQNLEKASFELEQKATHMGSIADKAVSDISLLGSGLASQSENMTKIMEKIGTDAAASGDKIGVLVDRVEESGKKIRENVDYLGTVIHDNLKTFEKGVDKSAAVFGAIRDNLGKQAEELAEISNLVMTKSRLSTAALKQQCDFMIAALDSSDEKVSNFTGALGLSTQNAIATVASVAKEMKAVSGDITERTEAIHKKTQNMVEAVTAIATDKIGYIEEAVNAAVAAIGGSSADMYKNAEMLTGSAGAAQEQIDKAGASLDQQCQKIAQISQASQSNVKMMTNLLKDHSDEFQNTSEAISKNVKFMTENIAKLTREFDQITDTGSAKTEEMSTRLRSSISEVAANSERIAEDVRAAGESFLRQSDALTEASEAALAKFAKFVDTFAQNAQEVVNVQAVTAGLREKLAAELAAIGKVSRETSDELLALKEKHKDAENDTFLKEASLIMEKLEAMAVDLTRVFQPNVEEELWKRYYAGDHSAFMRYLSKALDKQTVAAIRGLFEKDGQFRGYAANYMREFEQVLARARQAERSEVLIAILTGSDIGKLYMILSRALNNRE